MRLSRRGKLPVDGDNLQSRSVVDETAQFYTGPRVGWWHCRPGDLGRQKQERASAQRYSGSRSKIPVESRSQESPHPEVARRNLWSVDWHLETEEPTVQRACPHSRRRPQHFTIYLSLDQGGAEILRTSKRFRGIQPPKRRTARPWQLPSATPTAKKPLGLHVQVHRNLGICAESKIMGEISRLVSRPHKRYQVSPLRARDRSHKLVPDVWRTVERQDSMWEMWFIYFAYVEQLFTVYNNLGKYNSDAESCLCINRREVGLHYSSKGKEDYCKLLTKWKDEYAVFPNYTVKLDWNGLPMDKYY